VSDPCILIAVASENGPSTPGDAKLQAWGAPKSVLTKHEHSAAIIPGPPGKSIRIRPISYPRDRETAPHRLYVKKFIVLYTLCTPQVPLVDNRCTAGPTPRPAKSRLSVLTTQAAGEGWMLLYHLVHFAKHLSTGFTSHARRAHHPGRKQSCSFAKTPGTPRRQPPDM